MGRDNRSQHLQSANVIKRSAVKEEESDVEEPTSTDDEGTTVTIHVTLKLTWRRAIFCGAAVVVFAAAVILACVYGDDLRKHMGGHLPVAALLSLLFAVGLFMVAVEDIICINKSSVMLITATLMWIFHAVGYDPSHPRLEPHQLHRDLRTGLENVGSVVLFLLPAMAVVESIDHFDGFAIVTYIIRRGMAGNRERLVPIISILTFFLSSIIDNLTSTIVALKILHHVASEDADWRRLCGGVVVIASNAGGTWSPIGDVTTIMLWIQGKITARNTIIYLLLPSLVAGLLPMIGLWWTIIARSKRKEEDDIELTQDHAAREMPMDMVEDRLTPRSILVFVVGIICILLVPALKGLTGLPPFLGMLFALGLMWLATDRIAAMETVPNKDHGGGGGGGSSHSGPPQNGVMEALHKVDLTGLLFFTGVLLAVGALDSCGVLHKYANILIGLTGQSPVILSSLLGLSSAVVDNVPLVEASIEMFDDIPQDDRMWQLIALTASAGGSMTSVGSIAGVTFMSMEGVSFLWYCRNMSFWAAVGFVGSIATYQAQLFFLH